jgi:hypothetical protein
VPIRIPTNVSVRRLRLKNKSEIKIHPIINQIARFQFGHIYYRLPKYRVDDLFRLISALRLGPQTIR